MARLFIDAWDPGYGASLEPTESAPASQSSAQLDVDVEVPAASWAPRTAPAGLATPEVVLLVDGVRRIDARVWCEADDGTLHPGLASSYAAGVVRCDQRRGVAEVAAARVCRGLFTPSPSAPAVPAGGASYQVIRVDTSDPAKLANATLPHLHALEVSVSAQARQGSGHDLGKDGSEDDLLVVDGPLQERGRLPRALGYIKTHRTTYLPPRLAAVATQLTAGQRTPVFGLGTRWRQYAWYLRLPGPPGSPWAGIVRVECSAELDLAEVTRLADLSTVTLPRFASTSYKDPRAPQNLVPVAGLERRLRAMLGNPQLLHRGLLAAAARG